LAQLGRLEEAQTFLAKYQEKRPEVKKTSDYEKVAPPSSMTFYSKVKSRQDCQ